MEIRKMYCVTFIGIGDNKVYSLKSDDFIFKRRMFVNKNYADTHPGWGINQVIAIYGMSIENITNPKRNVFWGYTEMQAKNKAIKHLEKQSIQAIRKAERCDKIRKTLEVTNENT